MIDTLTDPKTTALGSRECYQIPMKIFHHKKAVQTFPFISFICVVEK